jgi:hypothetical protein
MNYEDSLVSLIYAVLTSNFSHQVRLNNSLLLTILETHYCIPYHTAIASSPISAPSLALSDGGLFVILATLSSHAVMDVKPPLQLLLITPLALNTLFATLDVSPS